MTHALRLALLAPTTVPTRARSPPSVTRGRGRGLRPRPAGSRGAEQLLERSPAIDHNNTNLAAGGATAQDLVPAPELVLIQIMDNDIACPATRADYLEFEQTFVAALRTLADGLPSSSRFFVVSQFGSMDTLFKVLSPRQREIFGGAGPCAFVDSEGKLVPRELTRLERIVRGYEAALEAGCERFRQCAYDDGPLGRIVDRPEYISADLSHATVAGQAKTAEVAWDALRRAGLIPRR